MVPMRSVSDAPMPVPISSSSERVDARLADSEESVVADLDDPAHLPERLDREVAAALEVVPLLPARQRGDERRVVDRHDRRTEHEPGRVRLADLQQPTAPKAVGARHALRSPGPE